MKVWAVFHHTPYEGDDLQAIFYTEMQADNWIASQLSRHRYTTAECEIQGEPCECGLDDVGPKNCPAHKDKEVL